MFFSPLSKQESKQESKPACHPIPWMISLFFISLFWVSQAQSEPSEIVAFVPGYSSVIEREPVTTEQMSQALKNLLASAQEASISRPVMQMATSGGLAQEGTCPGSNVIAQEIQELARALRCDPRLIYQYVHDQIDIEVSFGHLKGALGTLRDGYGNAAYSADGEHQF